jgi:alpha-amylase
MKRFTCLLLAAAMVFTLFGCGGAGEKIPQYEDFADSYTDALPENAEDGLTLHAFNWTYGQILANLENIQNAGFKNVLTMPVQQPKSGGSAWWAFYQPLGFSIGDSSPLGTKEELEELCAEAEKRGICILADIVVNHLATTDDEGKEPDGTPTVSPAVADYEPEIYRNRNEDVDGIGVTFHHNRTASGSGAETQYYAYGNLPDLDTSNPYVQQRVLALLEECIDAGVDGFRFDAAKHIETSSDPDYPSDFWENTVLRAKEYYKQKTGRNLYVYGEILNAPAGRGLSNYTDIMRITDDGYASQFRNAFASKDPSKILNASLKTDDPSDLIAWVESHDEYVTSNTHYSDVRVAKCWSVIAAKKDLGGLYLARPTEELTVGRIGSYAFESEYVAVGNRFHNRFYNADSYESVSGTCYVNEKIGSGDQGVLILNLGETDPEKTVRVDVPHLDDGNYYDALTGSLVVVSDHVARVQFEANGMAVITRSRDVHPRLEISERDCTFVGEKEITLKAVNCDEAYCFFNGDSADRQPIDGTASVRLDQHLKDGRVDLGVYLRKGNNEFQQTLTYRQVQLIEGAFNVINLADKYLNGDYELYIWSWSPGVWSQNYEIRDGVMLVDTAGMTGFLVAAFEKGHQIQDIHNWDGSVIKQSADITGDILASGFFDMSGF